MQLDEVKLNKKNEVTRIGYLHSTSDYLDQHGVRKGNIHLIDKNKSLIKQRWEENYQGKNWTKKDFQKTKSSERGIYRLTALQPFFS